MRRQLIPWAALALAAWAGPAWGQSQIPGAAPFTGTMPAGTVPAPAAVVPVDRSTVTTPPIAGQAALPAAAVPLRINRFFAAPGFYGMSFGQASYGLTRTYSEFASPYGFGYSYGYGPYGLLPGRYGVGLWRPGFVESGYVYGGAYSYRTFPVPYVPGQPAVLPPVGAYAPAFGPGFSAW